MRRVIVGYLCATSVLLHVLLVVALVTFTRMGKQMAGNVTVDRNITGRIADVAIYRDGDLTYSGYVVDWNGKRLYVPGFGEEIMAVGDPVNLMIQKQDFVFLRSMSITARRAVSNACAPEKGVLDAR